MEEAIVDLTSLAWKNLLDSLAPSTILFAAETLRCTVTIGAEEAFGLARTGVLMLRRGLVIPSPGDRMAAGRWASSTGDFRE